jgi:hypothetical protein
MLQFGLLLFSERLKFLLLGLAELLLVFNEFFKSSLGFLLVPFVFNIGLEGELAHFHFLLSLSLLLLNHLLLFLPLRRVI